ncbi:MAG: transcriptional regulator [Acidobacteriota bacterium]
MPATRFRFGPFLVSPAHRTMRRLEVEVPLIPRYFDLLVLLVAQRHRVVTRQEIFDRVWGDVVVSDGALSQAVRSVRRCLGDDPKDPQFIRTVSRHGYQFVAIDVLEESDDGPLVVVPLAAVVLEAEPIIVPDADTMAPLLDKLLRRPPFETAADDERHDAAEQLHALGTAAALERLDSVPGHAEARAILRDARWDVPGAGPVPLIGSPAPWKSSISLVALRFRRAARYISNRWGSAALGGGAAGITAGIIGGIALWLAPGSQADRSTVVALAAVGAVAGVVGAGGVGAGLATAEALARSRRTAALTACGALGGALAGGVAHFVVRAAIMGVFGQHPPSIGGWIEGLVLGGAAGFGYAISTSLSPGGGLAGPRRGARAWTSLATGLACALAGLVLTLAGRHLVGASLDALASAFNGSSVGLAPIGRLLGEESLRPVTRALVSTFEGLMFGSGLAFGLTHRPGGSR